MSTYSVFIRSALAGLAIIAACSACSSSSIPAVTPPSGTSQGTQTGISPRSGVVEITPNGFTDGNQAYAWCAYGNLYVIYTAGDRGGLTSTAQDPVCVDDSVPQ